MQPIAVDLLGQLGGHLPLLQRVIVGNDLVLGTLLHHLSFEQLLLDAARRVEELLNGAPLGLVCLHLLVQNQVHIAHGIVRLLLLGTVPLGGHVLAEGSKQQPTSAMQG